MEENKEADIGLTKKGLVEVDTIVTKRIDAVKHTFTVELKTMRHNNEKKFDEIKERSKEIIDKLDEINLKLLRNEFQNNWRTAFWVFMGSAIPVVCALIYLSRVFSE